MSYRKLAAIGVAAAVAGALGFAGATVVSDSGQAAGEDVTIFCSEFVPAERASWDPGQMAAKWAMHNPGERESFIALSDAICAGSNPALPVMATFHGQALLAVAKMALTIDEPPGTTTTTTEPPTTTTTTTETTTTTAPPPSSTFTSSVNDGDTVEAGTTWTVTTDPDAEFVEFWVEGTKRQEDTTDPYEYVLSLAAGTYRIGFCYTIDGERTCSNAVSTGVHALITITTTSPAGFDIPAFNTTLLAGPGVGTNGRIGWWRQYKSANNTFITPGGGGTPVPHLASPAPTKREATGPRSWVWWLCGSITVPTNVPATKRASATINPHNSSYDVGPDGIAGIGWGYGNGVSPLHIFYIGDGYVSPNNPDAIPNSFELHVAPQGGSARWTVVPSIVKGHRYDLCIEWIMGRLDQQLGLAGPGVSGGGIGNHPNNGYGRVRVFVDGALVVNTGNINTLHRATAPDGKTYTQTLAHRPWDGAYVVPGLPETFTLGRTLTRVGVTLADALADEPPFTLHQEWGEGGGSHISIAPLNSSDFRAPE